MGIHTRHSVEIIMPSLSRLNSALAGVAGSAIHAAVITALAFGGFGYAAAAAAAETPPEPATSAGLSAAELVELVGPVALYPDELLAIVLPASTWPLQIVQAARFLKKHESNPELEPDEEWDTSVLGLLNYPEVINLMNEDLNWTWKLGEAVTNQQEEIMDAIQDFRGRAYGAGNLESNEHMTVTTEVEASDDVPGREAATAGTPTAAEVAREATGRRRARPRRNGSTRPRGCRNGSTRSRRRGNRSTRPRGYWPDSWRPDRARVRRKRSSPDEWIATLVERKLLRQLRQRLADASQ